MSAAQKIVLITGCSAGGIGFSLCKGFAAQGCKVWATSRRVATMVGLLHPNISLEALDVGSDEDIKRVIKTILEKDGRIDILVNNAGVMGIGPLIECDLERVKNVFDTNVFAALRVSQAVFPSMADRKSGHVVNIGSIAGLIPTPWNGLYSATKSALHAITEVLEMEFRPFNIHVTLVTPGSIRSNIAKNEAGVFELAPNSRYGAYFDNIIQRMNASQVKSTTPTAVFSKRVVDGVLRKNPPTYMTLGGLSTLFALLLWLPRRFSFWLLWRMYTKGVKK